MKKLLGIVVLGLLWCNVGFANKLTISYFKKNLDEFKEMTASVCAEEPKEKHNKLYQGGCYDHRINLKNVEACIENWTEDCPIFRNSPIAWFERQKVKIENKRIESMFKEIPPENVSIPFQCYYDNNRAWIDYNIYVDRDFIEYHLFKYRRRMPDSVFDIGVDSYHVGGKLKLSMKDDTSGNSRYFPRTIEQRYDASCSGCEEEVKNYLTTISSGVRLNKNKIPKWDVKRSHNIDGTKTNEDVNSLNLTETSLNFEFKNQESFKHFNKNQPNEVFFITNDQLQISLSTGALNFYQFDKFVGGTKTISNTDIWNGICVGIEELYSYIKYVKGYKNKFEELRAKIRSETKKGEQTGEASGTAFFINKSGYLLTNQHVVEGCAAQKITYFKKDYDASIISTDKQLDLALLKVKVKPKAYIPFARDGPEKLQTIYVAGYPLGKSLSDDLKINDGKINSLKGLNDNSNEIQIDATINPGNSGGPIVNKKGELIGIAVSYIIREVAEGINFGIKSSAAQNFLVSNNLKPEKNLYLKELSLGKIVNLLEESTVYTYCN